MVEDERKLFVGGLPFDIVEAEVQEVFGLYGGIEEVHLNQPKEGKGFRSAFVRFDDAHDAAAAMVVLSDMYKFRETSQPVRVSIAWQKGAGKGYGDKGGFNGTPNGAPPPATSQPPVATPPPPAATTPLAPPPPAPSNRWSGGGDGGHNQWGDGYGKGKSDGKGDWGSGSYSRDTGGGKDPISGRDLGSKLWVGNLPGHVSEQDIEDVFKYYGAVESVTLLPNKSRSGQVCAFVHYAAPHQADACLQAVAQGYELKEGWGELKVERPMDRGSKGKGGGYGGYDKGKGKHYQPY